MCQANFYICRLHYEITDKYYTIKFVLFLLKVRLRRTIKIEIIMNANWHNIILENGNGTSLILMGNI